MPLAGGTAPGARGPSGFDCLESIEGTFISLLEGRHGCVEVLFGATPLSALDIEVDCVIEAHWWSPAAVRRSCSIPSAIALLPALAVGAKLFYLRRDSLPQ